MRDSFVFYRSFYDAIKLLPKKYQFAFVQALCEYALNEVIPESLPGGSMALFKALKPQIDVNNKRYANGCKGGRPKANQDETKPKPNNNQSITKPKPNDNVNVNANVNANVHVNDNANDNDNGLASSSGSGGSDDEFNIWKRMTPQDVDAVFDVYPDSGGDLIQAVYEDVKKKRKVVQKPVPYILGYAEKVGWDDKADHGGVS